MKTKVLLPLIFYAVMLNAQTGLIGEYFNGTDFEKKVLTRTDAKIDFAWWHTSPQEGVVNRAKLVADYLISKGISENRISFQGFGGTQPIITNPLTEEERAVNRRVEFVLK